MADFLQDNLTPKTCAHGFARGRNIASNAEEHVHHRIVLNIDLSDFFPTINFGRVRGVFMAQPFGASPKVATLLAQICCHEGSLPQGAPTSPVVSNMICFRMDAQLMRLAKEHGCFYTRYADDISFSKRKGEFPAELATVGDNGKAVVGKSLRDIIEHNGFRVHPLKVHLHHNTTRQMVTGLTVNNRVNVPRAFIRNIRAMIHDWRVNGYEAAETRHHANYYSHPHRSVKPPLRKIIEGKLSFLKMISGVDDPVRQNLQRQFVNVCEEYKAVMEDEGIMHDFFICHASEDKDDLVRPLAEALRSWGVSVWYDEYMLTIGDDLREMIDAGLANSRYGIVVLSPRFFGVKKTWPKREVGALFAMEDADGKSRVLPIWHEVTQPDVAKRSPTLARILAWHSADFSPEELAAKFRDFIVTRRR